MHTLHRSLAVLGLTALAGSAHAAALSSVGYSENFNSMGTSGTTPPAGWSVFAGNSGSSNTTWDAVTGIVANGTNSVATMVAAATPLTAITTPTAANIQGYNAAASASTTSDRVLATSPTGVNGSALQLLLTNQTGASFNQISLSYDTQRLTTVSSTKLEELPGYWLFFSLDGASWSNVSALNPTIATVPNTLGTTSVSNATINLGASVANGSNLYLRWVDDNAVNPSPDQIIGLNNVNVMAAVPEPSAALLLLGGLGLLGIGARLRRATV